ncbi:vascular-related unknown protein 1-like [Zingiber officinale]|uniref:Uncharacterized protein n=1 Tax=Zingiber officinale TaxID=94328 RepID=A0A8J5CFB1_ZINOF|nr:vascular-related unknown protein 1-like [Zingiber officinale]KAG6473181.1 hypothetical protein ZIOFF_067093 [Zingiber officinale]
MEESINSSMSNSFSCSMDGSEESGWTMYLEDFMASEEKSQVAAEASGCNCSSVVTLSTIYDAAPSTFLARQQQPSAKVDVPEDYTKLIPKRRKRLIMDDDSLEDTASSPVNSPKITESFLTTNPTKKDYQSLLHKGIPQVMNDERLKEAEEEFNLTEGTNEKYSLLKNRGLCLIPLSMLVDYL